MADEIVWRKARASGGQGGNCVEVAYGPDGRATGMVRDSKAPELGHLAVNHAVFAAFLARIKSGELGSLGTIASGGVDRAVNLPTHLGIPQKSR